jgi:hypothetical protein
VRERQAWGCIPIIPELRRLSQEDFKFKANVGYIARLSQKPKWTLY